MTPVTGFRGDFAALIAAALERLQRPSPIRPGSHESAAYCRDVNAEIELAASELERAAQQLRTLKHAVAIKPPLTLLELEIAAELGLGIPSNN